MPEYAWESRSPAQTRRDAEAAISREVAAELQRQHQKWGVQNHHDGTGLPRYAEKATAARLRCDAAHDAGFTEWSLVLLEEVYEALAEKNPQKLREELVQVAAVAVQWIASIDRREGSNG